MPGATSRRIVITAYDGISLLDLAGPLEASRVASTFGGPRGRLVTYECSVVSVRGGPVKTADGVALVTDSVRALSRMQIDTLIVPGAFLVDDVTRDRDLVQWVRKKAPTCRRGCSGCVGSFLLAAAGVLDGRRAATHWMHAPLLAASTSGCGARRDICARWQGVVFRRRDDGHRFGPRPEDAGRQGAMNVARMLVVYLKRAGGQSHYSTLLAAQVQSESETFDSLDRWIAEHLKDDLRVGALAEQVHMSPRNFARAYAEKRGSTPANDVEAIRLATARRRLEETEDRIESVAEDSGFSNEEQMRCSFIRILGIPPREYRKRFATTV